MTRARVGGMVVLAAALVLRGPTVQVVADDRVHVELTSPQSDDQGHCVRSTERVRQRWIVGHVSDARPLTGVTVNGTRARLTTSEVAPFTAPPGGRGQGFEALMVPPASGRVEVTVTDAAGDGTQVSFREDSQATTGRLKVLAVGSPGNPRLRCSLTDALMEQGELTEAVAEAQAAIRIGPLDARPHLLLGEVLARQGLLDRAIAELRAAARLDPTRASAHDALAWALEAQGSLPEAEAAARQAIRLDPASPSAHYRAGRIVLHERKWPEATALLREAVRLEPRYLDPRVNLAGVLAAQGRNTEAEAEVHQMLAVDPNCADAYWSLALLRLRAGKAQEAESLLRKAIALDPKDMRAEVDLGDLLWNQNRLPEAEAEFRRAVEIDPQSAPAHESLARVLHGEWRFDEAVAECRRAIALAPSSAYPYSGLALSLYYGGHYVEAEKALDQCLKLGGQRFAPKAADAIRRRAHTMRSWLLNPQLPMVMVFVPLAGLLIGMVLGRRRSQRPELYWRSLAWQRLARATILMAVAALGHALVPRSFWTGGVAPRWFDLRMYHLYALWGTIGVLLLGMVLTLCGLPFRLFGPGFRASAEECTRCGAELNLWSMYREGKRTVCAECWGATSPGPPRP